MSKITRLPISWSTRHKNRLGKFAVPCQVKDRWLEFAPRSAMLSGGEFITIDVMTETGDERKRVLAQVIVTREDLEAVLHRVKPDDDRASS